MTEEIAARQLMTELEDTPQCPHATATFPIATPPTSITLASTVIPSTFLIKLDDKIVIRIALKAFKPITRDFLLKVDFADRRADIVTVEVFAGLDVSEANNGARLQVCQRLHRVRGVRVTRVQSRNNQPVIVRIDMRVKGDLLLL